MKNVVFPLFVGAYVGALIVLLCIVAGPFDSTPKSAAPTQTVYIRNLAPRYFSDAEIKNDIPAWEDAMNKDFAPLWHTGQVKLVFIGRAEAPKGASTALFVAKGPVKGALAYHTVTEGAPSIVVYTGTADYYGYDNSISFTHEAQEMAADPTISVLNQGYWFDHMTVGDHPAPLPSSVWAQEVSDPVENASYTRPGANGKPVKISDFVTPNWFNDEVSGSYDFMQLVQEPFTILPGGYAQYFDFLGWHVVEAFRGSNGRDADGFLKGEKMERER